MPNILWKLGALVFALASPLLTYWLMLAWASDTGADMSPQRASALLLGAIVAFAIVVGAAALLRRLHGDEIGGVESFLVQLGPALSFVLLFGAFSNRFQLASYGSDPERYVFGGFAWGLILVIAWLGYRFWRGRA
jgi:hypothetical protein